MPADNVLGSVSVVITGDTSRLTADFAKAQSLAQTAGTQISSALNTGVTSGVSGAQAAFSNLGKSATAAGEAIASSLSGAAPAALGLTEALAGVKQATADLASAQLQLGQFAAAGNEAAVAAIAEYQTALTAAQASVVAATEAQAGAQAAAQANTAALLEQAAAQAEAAAIQQGAVEAQTTSTAAQLALLKEQYRGASASIRQSVALIAETEALAAAEIRLGHAATAASLQLTANAERATLDSLISVQARLTASMAELKFSMVSVDKSAIDLTGGIQRLAFAEALAAREIRIATEAQEAFTGATLKAGAAQHYAVSEIQATSGALRTLDGNGGIRAAERFLATTVGLGPALQAIFPIVGALAFAEIIARGVEHIARLSKGASDAAANIKDAFRDLNTAAEEANDNLRVANDKLENDIAKIEHKPENGIKLALDEAILSAEQLGKQLDKDLTALRNVATQQKVSVAGEIFGKAPTQDIEEDLKAFQRKVAETVAKNKDSIPRQESFAGVSILSPELLEKQKVAAQIKLNTDLTGLYTKKLEDLNHQLKIAQAPPADGATVDPSQRIEILTASIANLKSEAESLGLKTENANLQGEKAKAQAGADAARLAMEALKAEQSALKSAYSEMLSDLKSDHLLTVQEELSFWQSRLAEVDQFGNRYKDLHRDIARTIGNLHQEEGRERVKNQESLDRAAQKLYDTTKRVDVSNRELADKFAGYAEKYAASRAKIEAAGAKKLFEPKPEIDQTPINEPLKQLRGTAVGAGLDLAKAGFKTVEVQQSELDHQQQLIKLMAQTNAPIEQQLSLRQQILASQIALGESQGRDVSRQIIALGQLGQQQDRIRRQAEGLGPLYVKLSQQLSAQNIGGHLGAAAAKGIVDGKGIGRDIRDSLRGVGQELLGTVLKQAIQTLIIKLGIEAAAQAALGAVFGAVGTAQTVASTANTVALTANTLTGTALVVSNAVLVAALAANTAALAVNSVTNFFAEGGRPPLGIASIVGEKGPELFIPDQAGTIIPAGKFTAGAQTASGSISDADMFLPPGHGSVPEAMRAGLAAAAGSTSSNSSTSVSGMHFHAHGMTNPDAFIDHVMRKLPDRLKARSPQFSPYSR